jgi:hypothetical protein
MPDPASMNPDPDAQGIALMELSDADLVRRTLRLIMLDAAAPAAAKAQAARTLAEMVQLLGRDRVADPSTRRDVRGMTRAEIEAALAAED